jgi:hypothetical protein
VDSQSRISPTKSRPANPSPDDSQSRLAVLIDADNAQPSVIEGLLAEVVP